MFLKFLNRLLSPFELKLSRKNNFSIINDAFLTQKSLIRDKTKQIVIFDAGAAEGNTTKTYWNLFKGAKIYSFEPYKESFAKLKANCASFSDVNLINAALGDKCGKAILNVNNAAATNSLLKTNPEGLALWDTDGLSTKEISEIDIITIDSFIQSNSIDFIDILKMDVQGAEHLIIKGAEQAILKNKIGLIYCEIILANTYKNQKNFSSIIDLYYSADYSLYNVFNLNYDKKGSIRQMDAIFIKNK